MTTNATALPPALDIWIDELVTNVRRVALDHPDRIYSQLDESEGCLYVPDHANPDGCIVGAAARLTDHEFDHIDDEQDGVGVLEAVVNTAQEEFDHPIDHGWDPLEVDRRLYWLGDVQEQQDQGMTWSYAVTHADDQYPLEGR